MNQEHLDSNYKDIFTFDFVFNGHLYTLLDVTGVFTKDFGCECRLVGHTNFGTRITRQSFALLAQVTFCNFLCAINRCKEWMSCNNKRPYLLCPFARERKQLAPKIKVPKVTSAIFRRRSKTSLPWNLINFGPVYLYRNLVWFMARVKSSIKKTSFQVKNSSFTFAKEMQFWREEQLTKQQKKC